MVWFHDRQEAGRLLGERIRETGWDRARPGDTGAPLVVGLVRGGVPVAAAAARELGLELDAVVVRKVGLPSQPELALGALAGYAGHAAQVRNDDLLAEAEVREGADVFERAAAPERRELDRREQAVHGGRRPVPVGGRTVLVVDDGLATGATMLAAVEVLRAAGARRVVVAVPVALGGAGRRVSSVADGYVTLGDSPTLRAVGQAYRDFAQVDMATVVAALH